MVGPGRPFDTDRFFVICSNVVGGCMGTTGPGFDQSRDRRALRPRLSRRHDRRHGARPGASRRPSRHRQPLLRRRRLDGRHAGAAMGGRLSRARLRALPIATASRHSSQNIAFHEVGRQAIMADPDWRGGRYLVEGAGRQGARGRPDGRAHHLSVGQRAAPAIRPQPAGPRDPDVLLRRRLPDRDRTCATRARSSSSASTPIPIST